MPASPTVTVLAGPTAVGKGTVSTYVRDHYPDVWLSVSATTRAPRPGEVDGVHYFFVGDAEFDRMIDEDDLLEWAVVHNLHRYGTRGTRSRRHWRPGAACCSRSTCRVRAASGRPCRGPVRLLAPPSWDEMVHRLVGRGTETPEQQQRRLETAKLELAAQSEFDHTVVNDTVERAAAELVALMGLPGEQGR